MLKNIQKINSFGVGSFVFKVCTDEVQKTEAHISGLLEELRKIPGVENISIKPDPSVYKYITPYESEVDLSFLDTEFDIDLSAGDFSIEGENKFRFISRTQFDSIVTVIFPYFETQLPSDGVMRVREHILSFLKDQYTLEVIGPSPFHANFFINRTNFFGVNIKKIRGYDYVQVHTVSSDDNDVVEEIYKELADELDLFYLIRTTENERRESWDKVEKLVTKALKNPKFLSFSIKDQFPFRFLYNYLSRAMQSLAEFEASSLSLRQLINERFINTYSTTKSFLVSYIEEEKGEVYEYPIESTQNLLKFIADYRGRKQETINTYVNTFVNVILGLGVAIVLFFFGIK